MGGTRLSIRERRVIGRDSLMRRERAARGDAGLGGTPRVPPLNFGVSMVVDEDRGEQAEGYCPSLDFSVSYLYGQRHKPSRGPASALESISTRLLTFEQYRYVSQREHVWSALFTAPGPSVFCTS